MIVNQSSERYSKEVIEEDIIYLINDIEKTAKVHRAKTTRSNVIIPRIIKYFAKEYVVVNISDCAFKFSSKIRSIEFPPDSGIQSIGKEAFAISKIESLTIPASLIELRDGWCNNTQNLTTIKIDPRNPRYSYLDGKIIIGKTTENYDFLVFSRRDVTEVTIPSFIKVIGPYAFSNCCQLRQVVIPQNSELQTIEEYAFLYSSIESITISRHVTKICKFAFLWCGRLKRIDIPRDSELKTIEINAFCNSSLESITIPASLTELNGGCFEGAYKLTTIDIDAKNPSYLWLDGTLIIENCDVLAFARREITEVTIPSFIKRIGPYAFSNCIKLRKVIIPQNSELQAIDKFAFNYTLIESISIPLHVTKICESAFIKCERLRRIHISLNSEIEAIDGFAFSESLIKRIFIPNRVTEICEGTFAFCYELRMVEFTPNSKLQSIGKNAFYSSGIERFSIPHQVKIIRESAFATCQKLLRFDIPSNSELQTIEKNAFSWSSIESISIPPRVTNIHVKAFSGCKKLNIIEIDEKSELQLFDLSYENQNVIIMMPVERMHLIL